MNDFISALQRAIVRPSTKPITVIIFPLIASSAFGPARYLGISRWRTWRARSVLGLKTFILEEHPNATFEVRP